MTSAALGNKGAVDAERLLSLPVKLLRSGPAADLDDYFYTKAPQVASDRNDAHIESLE